MPTHGEPVAGSGAPVPPDEDTYPQYAIDRGRTRRWILHYARRGGIGAEFGVFRGHFAVEIAEVLAPRTLYLVDPWTRSGERFEWGDLAETNHNRLTTAQALADTRLRMAPYADRIDVEFAEQWSHEFCATLSTPLDFAYVDTDHGYETTLADLEAIAPVLAPGGVIMGDDWNIDPAHAHAGVMRAVNDFIRCRDFELVAAGPEMQWCIRRTPQYSVPRQWIGPALVPVPDEPPQSPAARSQARRRLAASTVGPVLRRLRAVPGRLGTRMRRNTPSH